MFLWFIVPGKWFITGTQLYHASLNPVCKCVTTKLVLTKKNEEEEEIYSCLRLCKRCRVFSFPDHRLDADSGKTSGDGRVWALSLHRNQGSSQLGTTLLLCHVDQR